MSAEFRIKRGTNISHWLSQSKARGGERRNWFTRKDVAAIAALGFDHIRLPVDEEQMWDERGVADPEASGLMDSCLDWCADAGLKAVVDLHILRSHFFNDKAVPRLFTDRAELEKFMALWGWLSGRLRQRPSGMVGYELLNEPVAPKAQQWNEIAMPVFRMLRAAEPDRTIILGSNWFNSVDSFDELEVPKDKNCVLTFHFYYPMFLTHYRASWWNGGRYDGPVRYPGAPISESDWAGLDADFRKGLAGENQHFDRAEMVKRLEKPLKVRDSTGLPLYCGEFGCYNAGPLELRLAWYRDIISVFREYGIAWANWDHKGGFGIFDSAGKPTGIDRALLG